MGSVGFNPLRIRLDTASTGIVASNSELDVTLITPGGVPGVLDEPVVEAGGGIVTVADGEDGVVEGGTAFSAVEDTGAVGLED